MGLAVGRPRSAKSTVTFSTIIRWCTNTPTAQRCMHYAGLKTGATKTAPARTEEPKASATSRSAASKARINGITEDVTKMLTISNTRPCFRRSVRAIRSTVETIWFPAPKSPSWANWPAIAAKCWLGTDSKSDFFFAPKVEHVRLDMEPPVKPDEKGCYPVPMPGITEFKI